MKARTLYTLNEWTFSIEEVEDIVFGDGEFEDKNMNEKSVRSINDSFKPLIITKILKEQWKNDARSKHQKFNSILILREIEKGEHLEVFEQAKKEWIFLKKEKDLIGSVMSRQTPASSNTFKL